MKNLLTFMSIALLVVASTLVGCGAGADNSTKKTDTSGQSKPKDSKAETDADEEGKERDTAAGGEAKSVTAPG